MLGTRRSRCGLFVGAMIAIGVCAPAAATAKPKFRPRVGTAMGLMPAMGQQEIATGTGIPVVFHGGTVMRGITIHTVFWAPSGHRFTGSPSAGVPGYEALMQQFLTDAAHDSSATAANIFSSLGEYPDAGGGGLYNFTYNPAVDSIDATDPYPPAGHQCVSPAGIATCVTDLQLQQELDRVVQAHDPSGRGLHDLWFIFLPPDVDTCISPAVCGTNAFAGYHSLFNLGHGATVYANIPDILIEGTPGPGQDPQGNPEAENGIDTVAHEAVEAITDPIGTGWMDPNGFEVADKCENPEYGTPLGYASNGSPYNQLINGRQYLIQTMWSNAAMGCKQSSSSTKSALPLARVNLTQFSPVVTGNIGTAKRGVPAVVLVARAGTLVAGGGAVTNAAGNWTATLHALKGNSLHAVGDDRDEILVRYGAAGPEPDLIETGNGGNPFAESGWTGWFALDHGYSVRSNAVLVGPCSQTGVLAVFVDGAATAPPAEQCETETDFAALQTKALRGGTSLRMSSSDNRAVTLSNPPGALIKLTIPLGEPRSVAAVGNDQVLFSPSGFPSCTADLRSQAVRCSGLVPHASYAIARRRGHASRRAKADKTGVARFSGFPGARGVTGGDVLGLRNGAGRLLTALHVAHLRVDLKGDETVVTGGSCEPGDYYGAPLKAPPTSLAIGVPGTGGTGKICPTGGKAKGLSTTLISQVDDQSGGQTRTAVPLLMGTSPVDNANLYGTFVALAQTGLPGPNGSTIGSGARVSLTITPASSRRTVFRAANVDTANGVVVAGLKPGSYRAKWVVIDANGDTRTVQTRFAQVR